MTKAVAARFVSHSFLKVAARMLFVSPLVLRTPSVLPELTAALPVCAMFLPLPLAQRQRITMRVPLAGLTAIRKTVIVKRTQCRAAFSACRRAMVLLAMKTAPCVSRLFLKAARSLREQLREPPTQRFVGGAV